MAANGFVNIHGKEYETVASRVARFREKHPGFTIETRVLRLDQDEVLMEARISDGDRLIANGHAQEFRQSSTINKTSYVENCETSAIGRALASFGIGGTEFASADEVAHAITNKRGPAITPTTGMLESLSVDSQNYCRDVAYRVESLFKKGDLKGATDEWESEAENLMEISENAKGAAWALIDSKARSAIKAEQIRRKEKAAA